ncbi:MAG: hypothetical protein BGO70_09395 [Bacteroidetes bacterium 43-93]|nr:YdcF family protein [Bacteroidota bacterium]OJX00377.1 MAG: hypothetical protein BGO70_09395 [Bacteroidetes bacterium 43-93]
MLSSLLLQLVSCITPRRGPQRLYNTAVANNMSFDAIIVPGIPYHGHSWDSVMKARVIWSWILYKNGLAKNVIYSGDAVYTPYKEAIVMGLYGQKLGIPKEHIFYDTNARHSTENVYYSYIVAKKLGFKSIALASDPFQTFLLKGFLKRRFGTPIYRLPFITDTLAVYNHLNPHINARPALVQDTSFLPITQQESFFKRLRGTFGRDIDWAQYKDGKLESL